MLQIALLKPKNISRVDYGANCLKIQKESGAKAKKEEVLEDVIQVNGKP
jgi:hypothetical protein